MNSRYGAKIEWWQKISKKAYKIDKKVSKINKKVETKGSCIKFGLWFVRKSIYQLFVVEFNDKSIKSIENI